MSDAYDGDGLRAPVVDEDQAHAFRLELGTFNRENLLASGDVKDHYLRMSHPPPSAQPKPMRRAGGPENAILSGWNNFQQTTTDRDIDAEKQDNLHDGQLFRLNRAARGEHLQQPARFQDRPSGGIFGSPGPHPGRQNEQALDPVLNNPAADPMAIAKALRFKGGYNDKGGKRRPPGPNAAQSGQFNPNGAVFGMATRGGSGGRGGGRGGSRGGFSPGVAGRSGPGHLSSLNPHADIHADQRQGAPRGLLNGAGYKKDNSSVVVRDSSNNKAQARSMPANGRANPTNGKVIYAPRPVHQANGHSAPAMARTNSAMSTATSGTNSSRAIFATGQRASQQHGALASSDEFMAAVRKSGLIGSKYAPGGNATKPKDEEDKPEADPSPKSGLAGSKYANGT